jgi:hypothetical protein
VDNGWSSNSVTDLDVCFLIVSCFIQDYIHGTCDCQLFHSRLYSWYLLFAVITVLIDDIWMLISNSL